MRAAIQGALSLARHTLLLFTDQSWGFSFLKVLSIERVQLKGVSGLSDKALCRSDGSKQMQWVQMINVTSVQENETWNLIGVTDCAGSLGLGQLFCSDFL